MHSPAELEDLIQSSMSLEPRVLASTLLTAPPQLALQARDALATTDKTALVSGLGRVLVDVACGTPQRVQAAWLLKDLCATEAWPYLKESIAATSSPADVRLAALDAAERLAFAGVLEDSEALTIESYVLTPPHLLKTWVAVLADLGTAPAIAALHRYADDEATRSIVLAEIQDRDGLWIDDFLGELVSKYEEAPDVSKALERRAYASQRELWLAAESIPIDASALKLIWKHRDLGTLQRLVKERRLTSDAAKFAAELSMDGLSPSQRKLLRKIRAAL